jgi:hypothetical protein
MRVKEVEVNATIPEHCNEKNNILILNTSIENSKFKINVKAVPNNLMQ